MMIWSENVTLVYLE